MFKKSLENEDKKSLLTKVPLLRVEMLVLFKFCKTTKNKRIDWSSSKSEIGITTVGIFATNPMSTLFSFEESKYLSQFDCFGGCFWPKVMAFWPDWTF